MSKPDYYLSVPIDSGTKAWERLLSEIPVGAALQEAHFIFVPGRASISLKWVGRKPDGTQHQRTSLQSVSLSEDLGGARLLYDAYGSKADLFSEFVPRR